MCLYFLPLFKVKKNKKEEKKEIKKICPKVM